MRVLFICGSLEPGRDGVGDYTRRLAGELFKQGHNTLVVAINDRYIDEEHESTQAIEQIILPLLRVPSRWSSKRRFGRLGESIDKFQPNWVSLQFVPFSYQAKGLPYDMGKRLFFILKGRSLHLMFHELWVGMDEKSSWKYRIWGNLQKIMIRSLLNTAKPKITHTQSKLYQFYLNHMGIPTEHLPLFSNIPRNNKLFPMSKEGTPSSSGISLVIFGGIFRGAPVEAFSEEAARYSRETGIKLNLRIVGRNGAEQEKWLTNWGSNGLAIELLGEKTEEQLSEIFSSSHFAISTTPLPLIEKSGSVAAMLAHNLPIISVAKTWKPLLEPHLETPKGIVEYRPGNFAYCIRNRSYPQGHPLSSVSEQFVQSLTRY